MVFSPGATDAVGANSRGLDSLMARWRFLQDAEKRSSALSAAILPEEARDVIGARPHNRNNQREASPCRDGRHEMNLCSSSRGNNGYPPCVKFDLTQASEEEGGRRSRPLGYNTLPSSREWQQSVASPRREKKDMTAGPTTVFETSARRQSHFSPDSENLLWLPKSREKSSSERRDMFPLNVESAMHDQTARRARDDGRLNFTDRGVSGGGQKSGSSSRAPLHVNVSEAPRTAAPQVRAYSAPAPKSRAQRSEDLFSFLVAFGAPPKRSTAAPSDPQSNHACGHPQPSGGRCPASPLPSHTAEGRSSHLRGVLLDGGDDNSRGDGAKFPRVDPSRGLSGLEAYQRHLERAALAVSLERQRRKRY